MERAPQVLSALARFMAELAATVEACVVVGLDFAGGRPHHHK